MRYLTIPNSTLRVSNLCMGTVSFGSTTEKKESFRILDRFVEQGGNFLDTARIYADWVPGAESSASEKLLGQWIRERGNAHSIIIATKGGHPVLGTKKPLLDSRTLTQQIEDSCRFLCLDTLPLYYLHRDDVSLPVDAILDTLFLQQDRGLIQYLGCSNWHANRIAQANAYARSCGRQGFIAVSNRWSLAKCIIGSGDDTLVDMEDSLFQLHQQTQLAAIPFSSTAGGYLSKLAAGLSVRDSQRTCYGLPENEALARRAAVLAQELHVSVAQLALAYFYSQPFPVIPVTAFSSDQQLDEAAAASDLLLSQEAYTYLVSGK